MDVQDGGWRRAWEGAGRQLRDVGRGLADLVLPPLAHDSREATAAAGLTPDAWSQIKFLEAPVCDGCGAAFEFDGGAFAETRCAACIAQPYRFQRARAACLYDDHSRGLILRFKHGDQQQFAPLFARWIGRAAADLVRQAQLDYLPDALVRTSHTDSQGGKSRRGRRLNVKTAFAVTEAGRRRIKGRRILLIDDVLTTGATAEACARALIEAGARAVDLAVIARVRNARELTM